MSLPRWQIRWPWSRKPAHQHSTAQPGPVFARAKPEKAEITEEYRYRQEISVNPTITSDPAHTPTGAIEIIVPYDGHQFFSRTAVDDATKQAEKISHTAHSDDRSTAMIGHLALANVGETKTVEGEPLAPAHNAIPLVIPLRPAGEPGTDQLSADLHEAALRIEYNPPAPRYYRFPVIVQAQVFDPDDNPRVPDELRSAPATDHKRKSRRKEALFFEPIHQVAFSSELRLRFVIHLNWPRRSEIEPAARIRRVSLHWPTITSLTANFLRFDLEGEMTEVQYDPIRSRLEWSSLPISTTTSPAGPDDVETDGGSKEESGPHAQPMERRESRWPRRRNSPSTDEENQDERDDDRGRTERAEPTDGDHDDEDLQEGRTWSMRSPEITVFVKQPGQLRSKDDMHGEVEVEVDDLLSGIEARLFNARGKRHRKGTLAVRTRLTVAFTLQLTQEFARREIRTVQILHFDEIVPTRSRIDDIATALRDQGFDVEQHPGEPSRHTPSWALYACRTEGPSTIAMGLIIDGRLHRTRRRAETAGHPEYTSKMDSGELRITIIGTVPRSSHALATEINKLRESLGERFRHVQAQR